MSFNLEDSVSFQGNIDSAIIYGVPTTYIQMDAIHFRSCSLQSIMASYSSQDSSKFNAHPPFLGICTTQGRSCTPLLLEPSALLFVHKYHPFPRPIFSMLSDLFQLFHNILTRDNTIRIS